MASGSLRPHGRAQTRSAFTRSRWWPVDYAEGGDADTAPGAGLWAVWMGLMNARVLR